jgi:hypothetical protein
MVMEIRISEDYCRSDIQIYDLSLVGLGHIPKITLPLMKKYEMCAIVSNGLNILSTEYIHLQSYFLEMVDRNNTPIHNILSTAPQFSISQKALGTLPKDGNIMSKHAAATIHN